MYNLKIPAGKSKKDKNIGQKPVYRDKILSRIVDCRTCKTNPAVASDADTEMTNRK